MNKYSVLSALRLQLDPCASAWSHRTNAESADAAVAAASKVWWQFADSAGQVLPGFTSRGQADDHLDLLPPGLHIISGPKYTGKSFIFSEIAKAIEGAGGTMVPISIGEPTSIKHPSVSSIADLLSAMCADAQLADVTSDATMKNDSADGQGKNPVVNISLFGSRNQNDSTNDSVVTTPEYDSWATLVSNAYNNQNGAYVSKCRVFLIDSLSSFMTSRDATAGGYFPGGEPTKLVDALIELSTAFTALNWIVIATMNFHDFRGFVPDFPGSIGSSIDLSVPVPDSLTDANDIASFVAQHAKLRHIRIPVYRPTDSFYKVREVRYDDGSTAPQNATKPRTATSTSPVSAYTTLVEQMDNVPRL